MDHAILEGLILFFTPMNIVSVILGVGLGLVVGALPGLTATMAIALLSPLTFGFDPVTGISFLLGLYAGAIFGGSISAILIRTPGTPASAATIIDGHPLAQRGQGGKALRMAGVASLVGGLISAIFLALVSPLLAKVALKFGPVEYFALAVFGLTIIISVSGKSVLKGLSVGFFGLLLSTLGVDAISGVERLTFGSVELSEGISLVPVLIGMFALSQLLGDSGESNQKSNISEVSDSRLSWREIKESFLTMMRSGLIGSFIGAVPGTGAAIAAFLGYNEAKRTSKKKNEFGKGALEGVAAPEAANNAVTGTSLIPMLTLGIPGSAAAAVIMSSLLIHGITPGPMMFTNYKAMLWAIFIGFAVSNMIMFGIGWLGVPLFIKVLTVPRPILNSIILALCVIGSYSVSNSMFDVLVMLVSGVVGYVFIKFGFSVVPVVLAIVLGPIAEVGLRQAILGSNGDWSVLARSPICAVILLLSIVSIFVSLRRSGKAEN